MASNYPDDQSDEDLYRYVTYNWTRNEPCVFSFDWKRGHELKLRGLSVSRGLKQSTRRDVQVKGVDGNVYSILSVAMMGVKKTNLSKSVYKLNSEAMAFGDCQKGASQKYLNFVVGKYPWRFPDEGILKPIPGKENTSPDGRSQDESEDMFVDDREDDDGAKPVDDKYNEEVDDYSMAQALFGKEEEEEQDEEKSVNSHGGGQPLPEDGCYGGYLATPRRKPSFVSKLCRKASIRSEHSEKTARSNQGTSASQQKTSLKEKGSDFPMTVAGIKSLDGANAEDDDDFEEKGEKEKVKATRRDEGWLNKDIAKEMVLEDRRKSKLLKKQPTQLAAEQGPSSGFIEETVKDVDRGEHLQGIMDGIDEKPGRRNLTYVRPSFKDFSPLNKNKSKLEAFISDVVEVCHAQILRNQEKQSKGHTVIAKKLKEMCDQQAITNEKLLHSVPKVCKDTVHMYRFLPLKNAEAVYAFFGEDDLVEHGTHYVLTQLKGDITNFTPRVLSEFFSLEYRAKHRFQTPHAENQSGMYNIPSLVMVWFVQMGVEVLGVGKKGQLGISDYLDQANKHLAAASKRYKSGERGLPPRDDIVHHLRKHKRDLGEEELQHFTQEKARKMQFGFMGRPSFHTQSTDSGISKGLPERDDDDSE